MADDIRPRCLIWMKNLDSSLPSNYRPISLISCVGKIMERVICKHIYNYLHQNKLIYEYQSGFLPKHSTVHQLLEIYNSILNSLVKKEANCFVFCDFSKTFDKVWHRGLLH
jgi:lipid A disaccharide synthetase